MSRKQLLSLIVTSLVYGSGSASAQMDAPPLVIEAKAIDWHKESTPVKTGEGQDGVFWLNELCTNPNRWDPDGFSLKIISDGIPEGFTIAPVCRVHDKNTYGKVEVGPALGWKGGQEDTVSSGMAFHVGGWGADGIDVGYQIIPSPGSRVRNLEVGLRLSTRHSDVNTQYGPIVWTGAAKQFPDFAKVVPGAASFGGAELFFKAKVQRRKVAEGEANLLWPIVRKQKVVLPAVARSTLFDVKLGRRVSLLDVSAQATLMPLELLLPIPKVDPQSKPVRQQQAQWHFTDISHSIESDIESSVEAALSCGVFFSGSFSRKNAKMQKTYEYTLAASLVSTSQQSASEVAPTFKLPRASRTEGEAKRITLLKHLRKYGTHYVAGYEEGYAVLVKANFEGKSVDESSRTITAFKAAFGSIKGGSDTTYSENERAILSSLKLEGTTLSGGMTAQGKDCSGRIANASVDEAREFLTSIRNGEIKITPTRTGVVLYSLTDHLHRDDDDLKDLLQGAALEEWE